MDVVGNYIFFSFSNRIDSFIRKGVRAVMRLFPQELHSNVLPRADRNCLLTEVIILVI